MSRQTRRQYITTILSFAVGMLTMPTAATSRVEEEQLAPLLIAQFRQAVYSLREVSQPEDLEGRLPEIKAVGAKLISKGVLKIVSEHAGDEICNHWLEYIWKLNYGSLNSMQNLCVVKSE